MAHLEHLFTADIRFDTDVQYLVQGPHGPRYENLPIRKSESAVICALTSIMQCVAMLRQIPRKRMLGRPRRAAQRRLGVLDDGGVVDCVRAFGTAVVAQLHPSGSVDEIGKGVRDALRSGHVCLLHFESARSSRWATVIGVELDRTTDEPRTLLLLDSSAGEPWACAHNVRIELQGTAGRSVNASAGFTLSCRHLTGEACAVRLRRLIVLKRSAPTPAATATTAS